MVKKTVHSVSLAFVLIAALVFPSDDCCADDLQKKTIDSVDVRRVKQTVPFRSLGAANVFYDISEKAGTQVNLKIARNDVELLQPDSIRLFFLNTKKHRWDLVHGSKYISEKQVVTARIPSSGRYTVIGFSRFCKVYDAQIELCKPQRITTGFIPEICKRILCPAEGFAKRGVSVRVDARISLDSAVLATKMGGVCESCMRGPVGPIDFPECGLVIPDRNIKVECIQWPWYSSGSETPNCSVHGSSSIFVADFNSDTIGSMPPPSSSFTALHYGPPGASLYMEGTADRIKVVDSAVLRSRAMKLTRSPVGHVLAAALVGDNGNFPYTSGLVHLEYRAYGEVINKAIIAGMSIEVLSAEGEAALVLRLYDGSYHLLENLNTNDYVPLVGSYNSATEHLVHIVINLDTRRYSICIDNEVLAKNKAFLSNRFTNVHMLRFYAQQMIFEAFPLEYVLDDIRITTQH